MAGIQKHFRRYASDISGPACNQYFHAGQYRGKAAAKPFFFIFFLSDLSIDAAVVIWHDQQQ
jgi:hypothetical protein